MTTPVFTGWIEKGFPNFSDDVIDEMTAFFKPLEGKAITMVVKPVRKNRSLDQNAYYWGVIIKLIADHAGYSGRAELMQIHDTLRAMFLRRTGMWGKQIVLSTTSLSTVEFEEYQSRIRQWSSIALNLYIPEPNKCETPTTYETGEL